MGSCARESAGPYSVSVGHAELFPSPGKKLVYAMSQMSIEAGDDID